MTIIKEHQALSDVRDKFKRFDPQKRILEDNLVDGLLLSHTTIPNENRYFFTWDSYSRSYVASFNIGVQRFGEEVLIVKPKFDNINFMEMFNVCLNSDIEMDSFSQIYGINFDEPPVKTNEEIVSTLTPLLIVHYLKVVSKIIEKGLRSDYIQKNDNLMKIKGKIDITKHEQKNIMQQQYDKVHCKYSERSFNTPENKLLKKALTFCRQFVYRMENNEAYSFLCQKLNFCLSHFENVDSDIEPWEVRVSKYNKLFKDYEEATRVAKLILRRFDNSLTNVNIKEDSIPLFWIDMPLLYEHYVLGKLKEFYNDEILYQASGHAGIPDFLCTSENLILDTKYKDVLTHSFSWDNIQQLSGYARDLKIRRNYFHIYDHDNSLIKCILIYPEPKINEEDDKGFVPTFNGKCRLSDLLTDSSKSQFYKEFYRICIPLPRMN